MYVEISKNTNLVCIFKLEDVAYPRVYFHAFDIMD